MLYGKDALGQYLHAFVSGLDMCQALDGACFTITNAYKITQLSLVTIIMLANLLLTRHKRSLELLFLPFLLGRMAVFPRTAFLSDMFQQFRSAVKCGDDGSYGSDNLQHCKQLLGLGSTIHQIQVCQYA